MLRIRAVLSDKPTTPLYLETIPRRGYRFIAPVILTGEANEAPVAIRVETPATRPARHFQLVARVGWIAIVSLIAGGAIALIGGRIFGRDSQPPLALKPITTPIHPT